MWVPWQSILLALVVASAAADNDTLSDECEPGLWGELLEEWALTPSEHNGRHGRVMSLPPTKGYYVSDRIDGPLMPPPPPPYHQNHHGVPHNGPMHNSISHNGPPHNGPSHNGPSHNGPPHSGPVPNGFLHKGPLHVGPMTHGNQPHPPEKPGPPQYDEWQASPPPPPAGGKIVNKPPNPYKDQFRPSYQAPPSPNHPIPLPQQQWSAADRLDAPAATPEKKVSETDLYLLSAIEKLVYRVDHMEKRLRKMEETLHYLVVGKETKPEPCASNFTRVGSGCYYFSPDAGDWKAASLRCRKMRTHLLELDTDDEKRVLFSALLADNKLKGTDFWTGGLNPGLLWIWAHSARPVMHNATIASSNSTAAAAAAGSGRCLALQHDAARARYVLRGLDCSLRQRFVCELPDEQAKDLLSNEIQRAARQLRPAAAAAAARRAKVAAWPDLTT